MQDPYFFPYPTGCWPHIHAGCCIIPPAKTLILQDDAGQDIRIWDIPPHIFTTDLLDYIEAFLLACNYKGPIPDCPQITYD